MNIKCNSKNNYWILAKSIADRANSMNFQGGPTLYVKNIKTDRGSQISIFHVGNHCQKYKGRLLQSKGALS